MEIKGAHKGFKAKIVLLAVLSVAIPTLGCSLGTVTGASSSATGGATTGGSTTGGSSSSAPTATATHVSAAPTATTAPVSAPTHAFAWFQYDSHNAPQIWASLNGGVPKQITHIGPPSTTGCNVEVAWSPPVFSPDLTHIVAALGSYQCGDGDMYGPASIISVSTGTITQLPGGPSANEMRVTERDAGWLNNSTIWYIGDNGNAYTYHLGAASKAQLPGIANAVEGVVRGATFFWDSINTTNSAAWYYTLRRYSLTSHSALSGSVNLGGVGTCKCSPGDFHTPGWDASPTNGAHIAYQVVTPSSSINGGIASSHIYYASANGTGVTHIAQALITNQLVKMQLSPNGQWLAFTNALPSPATLTASVSSSGGSGDPTFHAYTHDTYNYPVWKWDSTQFWAGSVDAADTNPPTITGVLFRFNRGAGSAVGVSGGYNPWYTIG